MAGGRQGAAASHLSGGAKDSYTEPMADQDLRILHTVQQLAAFNDVARTLMACQELREVVQAVAQTVTGVLGPRNWSLLLWNEQSLRLEFAIAVGVGAERLPGAGVRADECIAGQAFVQQSVLHRNDVKVKDDADLSLRLGGPSDQGYTVFAVPLSRRQRLGVVEFLSDDEGGFTPDDLDAIVRLAELIGIAIENAQNFERVERLTITDEVTGLYNTRHFRTLLDHEVSRCRRFQHNLSLIFLDLDHFKLVNDKHGHLAGTSLLREMGPLLMHCIRGVDCGFRYGGDEFGLLLVETDTEGALRVAQRVLETVRTHRFLTDRGLSVHQTVSVGVATFPVHASSSEGLIHAADLAMYSVKQRSRNDVDVPPRVASEEPTTARSPSG
jgi:diguanylate cyclase (GGDEF)-like protein